MFYPETSRNLIKFFLAVSLLDDFVSALEVSRLEQDSRIFGDVFVKQRVTLLSKAKSDGSQLDGSNKIGQQMQGNTLKKGVTQRRHSMKPPDHREPSADRFI